MHAQFTHICFLFVLSVFLIVFQKLAARRESLLNVIKCKCSVDFKEALKDITVESLAACAVAVGVIWAQEFDILIEELTKLSVNPSTKAAYSSKNILSFKKSKQTFVESGREFCRSKGFSFETNTKYGVNDVDLV